jgi:hypothetical protein
MSRLFKFPTPADVARRARGSACYEPGRGLPRLVRRRGVVPRRNLKTRSPHHRLDPPRIPGQGPAPTKQQSLAGSGAGACFVSDGWRGAARRWCGAWSPTGTDRSHSDTHQRLYGLSRTALAETSAGRDTQSNCGTRVWESRTDVLH